MFAEDRNRMKDAGSSSVSHVSRKPLQCIDVTIPVIITLSKSRFETTAMTMIFFSNRTRLSFSLFNGGKIGLMSYSN